MAKVAKAKKPSKKALPGPLLAVAVFCEQTIEDTDKTISCIRIADTITITLPHDAPPDVPSDSKRIPIGMRGLVSFRRGGAASKVHRLKLVMQSPDGKTGIVEDREVKFGKELNSTVNARFDMTIAVKKGGMFWMTVLFDDEEYTRVPLIINVERASAPVVKSPAKRHKAIAHAGPA
jgi:hypothetical protein